jgi:LysR family transcriptional regulator, transcriptional activator of nhaA
MAALNFHHLRYFRAVARAGTLTRAAAALHISPSALSVQVQHLEAQLGQSLFERRGRQLILTEAGRIALDHAETIFAAGDELVQTLKGGPAHRPATVRVGALATFQVSFLAPLRKAASLHLVLRSGTLSELLAALQAHQLDVLLTNTLPARDKDSAWTAHQLA